MAIFIFKIFLCHFANRLLIGTYTSKQRGGIYLYAFNEQGKLEQLQHVADADDPSYLAIHPNGQFVYAVNEGGGEKAKLSAFALKQDHLRYLNSVPSGGDHPCYISIHRSGKWAAVANYSGGNMTVFPIKEDGSVAPFIHDIQHSGKSVFEKRQDKPHAHAAVFNNDRLYLTDLGLDQVFMYDTDPRATHLLQKVEERSLKVQAGAGPRHLAFHPTLPVMYVIEEITGTVSVFTERNHAFSLAQRIVSSSDATSEDKGSADIHISPDGKFLYASNRAKANDLALFKVNEEGKLYFIEHIASGGEQPRNFVIHPSGHWLLVAGQRTNNVVVFKRDLTTGKFILLE